MKAAIVLLADTAVSNLVRKLAWESHIQYQVGLGVSRLPPHISLKQPFAVQDLPSLEGYLTELAASIRPFVIQLSDIQLIPTTIGGMESGILWVDVVESSTLRRLHQRVNQELAQRFSNTQAEHDGAEYHFHLSVAIGGQPLPVYQQLYNELLVKEVNREFVTSELALFVYDEPIVLDQGYMTYKVLPLGG